MKNFQPTHSFQIDYFLSTKTIRTIIFELSYVDEFDTQPCKTIVQIYDHQDKNKIVSYTTAFVNEEEIKAASDIYGSSKKIINSKIEEAIKTSIQVAEKLSKIQF